MSRIRKNYDYKDGGNFWMTDYGYFMTWCADKSKEPTPESFMEFISIKNN